MLSFMTDELVWAIRREREEEARNVRPHTPRMPNGERITHDAETRAAEGSWIARTLRANAS